MDKTLLEIQRLREANSSYGNQRFHKGPPFQNSKNLAKEFECDIAVPSGDGLGNIICFTRVVEELARKKGRALKLLSSAINPLVGVVDDELHFPIWKNNPFVHEIVDTDSIDIKLRNAINGDQDNCFQFSHFLANVCHAYNVRSDIIKPSLFLDYSEQLWAINKVRHLKRPLICIHPSGTSSSLESSGWYCDKWKVLVSRLSEIAGIVQIGMEGFDLKETNATSFSTTIRQMMALIWVSDIFIGFDSGPAHIATAFNKPAAVLWDVLRKNAIEEHIQEGFGASAMTRWSYPQNFNLMLLGEKDNECSELLIKFVNEQINQFNS